MVDLGLYSVVDSHTPQNFFMYMSIPVLRKSMRNCPEQIAEHAVWLDVARRLGDTSRQPPKIVFD